jgi:hypothetical protein
MLYPFLKGYRLNYEEGRKIRSWCAAYKGERRSAASTLPEKLSKVLPLILCFIGHLAQTILYGNNRYLDPPMPNQPAGSVDTRCAVL